MLMPPDKGDKAGNTADPHKFNFDYVFDCDTNQPDVYNIAAAPIFDSLFLHKQGITYLQVYLKDSMELS